MICEKEKIAKHMMALPIIIVASTGIAGAAFEASHPVSGDVEFNGTVYHTCNLNAEANGTLKSSDPYTLTSTAGSPGQVSYDTAGGVTISVTAPDAFINEPASVSPTFTASIGTNGNTSHTINDVNDGTLNIHLQATNGSTPFPTGLYKAIVTVTCSPSDSGGADQIN